ncbi:hypothetical protein [Anaerotignum sp.]|uniref:hypothetical protein n=1 Tax=Anaerotignum sp. TaxID=2039241 RepID=UPI0028AF28F1|nr:hypothetical protein [Anaerotignum sp.]
MKQLKKVMSFSLAVIMMCTMGLTVYASDNENAIIITDEIELSTDSTINYTEQRSDGTYYITENINGNRIESTVYKVEGKNKILNSSIVSNIQNGKVLCVETKPNGDINQYEISADISGDEENLTQSEENITLTRGKTYIRTDRYGISLVGKKVTVAIAAGAIVAATAYVSLPVAVKIISAAIAGGAGAGVATLPDYLYVTSDVYTSRSSGKIYTRYENKYYLDSARTKYVGAWTFSKRWGH